MVADPRDTESPVPDEALTAVLAAANHEATQRRHRFVTLEHLFLAVLADADAAEILTRCGADVAELGRELREYLDLLEEVHPRAPLLHPRSLAMMRYLANRVVFSGRHEVGVRDLVVALRSVKDDYAALLMHAAGIDRLDLLRVISHGTSSTSATLEGAELARVCMHNDDYTPMEFVVNVLCAVFRLSEAEAHTCMMEIHVQGSVMLKVMSVEQAIEKVEQVFELAAAAGYPLRCSLAPA